MMWFVAKDQKQLRDRINYDISDKQDTTKQWEKEQGIFLMIRKPKYVVI